jgi:hypothetical protein
MKICEIVKLNVDTYRSPQELISEAKAEYKMTDLDPYTFDQTKAGWRSLPTLALQADAVKQYIDTYVKNGKFVNAPRGDKTIEPSILYWHLGQIWAYMGRYRIAINVMRKAMNDRDQDWNAYVMATISFLRKDRRAFDHWAQLVHDNKNTIKRLTAGWGKSYKQAY